jgi:hypothetical protein
VFNLVPWLHYFSGKNPYYPLIEKLVVLQRQFGGFCGRKKYLDPAEI